MNLKKEYHTLSKLEFDHLIDSLKNTDGCIKFFSFDHEYFYYPDVEVISSIYELEKEIIKFKELFNSFNDFSKNQLKQTFLIDEIKSTNEIEGIYSTRHDIFYILNKNNLKLKGKEGKKVISLINGYLYYFSNHQYNSLKSIKDAYDYIILPTIEDKKDYPDGKMFRAKSVYVTDGINIVHTGFNNEEKINNGLLEFISIYNNKNINLYLRALITHFMFETIHPFYDGNGRLGRFLISSLLMNESDFNEGVIISKSILKKKDKYYHALEIGRDYSQSGCINEYILEMISILLDGYKDIIEELENKVEQYNKYKVKGLTKKENLIFDSILSGTIFSLYGVSVEEIINNTKTSRRTIVSTLQKLRKMYQINEVTYGKKVYYSFDINSLK